MSKNIVSQMVKRAQLDVNRAANEAALPDAFKRIQDGFRNSAQLVGNETLAELTGLITGFRPRTTACQVVPFEVFEVMSKAEQRVVKTALCVAAAKGNALGISALNESALCFSPDTCRVADEEAALKFIDEVVGGWEDAALLCWVANNLGTPALPTFLAELERGVIPAKAAK